MTGPNERPPYAGGSAERSFAPSVGGAAHPSGGVPPRPSPLPPPRPSAGGASPGPSPATPPRAAARSTSTSSRPAQRGRRARLTLRRIDPWSVFLWSVVASIFLGLALLVCVGVLYALLSSLGVLDSLNTLINDVTSDPADTSATTSVFSAGRVMSIAAVVAALDVVLFTALATLGAFLYNLCASLTGGIEVTLGDRE